MAVLVEALSVIIRREAIQKRFTGGWAAFERIIPNRSVCADDHLVRVGFMTPTDTRAYVSTLEAGGMVFKQNGEAIDLAVVDQMRGPTTPASWLEVGTLQTKEMKVMACWLSGTKPQGIALPQNWKYEKSLSKQPGFAPGGADDDRLKFLRRENSLDVYLDLVTGKEVFVGRPVIQGEDEAVLFTRLEKIFHEALDLEGEMQPLAALGDKKSLAPLTRRLEGEFLVEVEQMMDGQGAEMSFAHFTHGLILRILLRRADAEMAFRRANQLQPGVINTLRELVRCLGEQDKHEEALPFAREATEVEPADAGAWGNLAMCLVRCGERAEARKAIDFAIDLDPQDPINRTIRDNFDRYFE